jgi:drug/metabolite transporter (DMT)-like permease
VGGLCIVVNWIAFFAALNMTSIATTTIVYHVQPFFVVLLGAWCFGDRITPDQGLWMLGAFAGVVLASGLVVDPLLATGAAQTADPSTWALGIALALVAAFLYAAATLIAKGLGGQRPEVTALSQTTVGVLLLVGFANFTSPVSAASWTWLVGIGVLHTGVSYVLMYAAYPRLTTPVIGILAFVYPLVAIAVDWLFYDRAIGWPQAMGMLLIALGTLGVKLGWPLRFWRATSIG